MKFFSSVAATMMCVAFIAGSLSVAPAKESKFIQHLRELFGYVPLGLDKSTVLVHFCNQTQSDLGVIISYAPRHGAKKSTSFVVAPRNGDQCENESISPSWFVDGLPASVTVSASTADSPPRQGIATIVVRANVNGVFFGTGDYCKKSYAPVPDEVTPSKNSTSFGCATLSK